VARPRPHNPRSSFITKQKSSSRMAEASSPHLTPTFS
jgi:hypothetical protein